MAAPSGIPLGKRLLRCPDVLAKVGKSKASLYKMIRVREFPAPIPISSSTVAWLEAEVDAWIQSRIDLRDKQAGGAR